MVTLRMFAVAIIAFIIVMAVSSCSPAPSFDAGYLEEADASLSVEVMVLQDKVKALEQEARALSREAIRASKFTRAVGQYNLATLQSSQGVPPASLFNAIAESVEFDRELSGLWVQFRTGNAPVNVFEMTLLYRTFEALTELFYTETMGEDEDV